MPEQFRIRVFGEPRTDWRDTPAEALTDAVNLGLASWDASKREWFLAVPVGMQRRGTRDAAPAYPSRRSRHREAWTDEDIEALRRMAREGEPVSIAAVKLGRSSEACSTKARQHGIDFTGARRRP